MNRFENLSILLSFVKKGELSALVAASQAGLIQPCEDNISEEAALFRLQWEIENLQIE